MRSRQRHRQPLALETRGNVQTEYLVVVWGVCLVGAAALVTVGLPLLELFHFTQAVLVTPVP